MSLFKRKPEYRPTLTQNEVNGLILVLQMLEEDRVKEVEKLCDCDLHCVERYLCLLSPIGDKTDPLVVEQKLF